MMNDDKESYTYRHHEQNGLHVNGVEEANSCYGSVENVGSKTSLEGCSSSVSTTRARFWILLVFSVLCWTHGMLWATWGPISESMYAAFPGWGPPTVAMMTNWGTIMFTITMFPMCWATIKFGLRPAVICTATIVFLGTVIRSITKTLPFFTISCHLCAIMMGIASTILLAAPMLIAADWFPLHERTTAVAVMMGASQLGDVGSYLEPLLVRLPSANVSISDIQEDVMHLMYTDVGIAGLILLAVLVYFPSKPPNPPSNTSSTERLSFISSLGSLTKNKRFMVLLVFYGTCIGPPVAWVTVMNYSLLPLGIHQTESMWVAISAVIVSSISPIVSGRINDRVQGHIKSLLIFLLLASTACFYWFLLLTYGVLPFTKWQVYLSVIGGVSFNFATIPLFFEVAVDLAFPVPEILVSGIITAADNIASVLFLLVFFIPNVGYEWVTYTLVLSVAVTLLPVVVIRFDYTRSNIDSAENSTTLST